MPAEKACSLGQVQTPLFSLRFISLMNYLVYLCLLIPQNMFLTAFIAIIPHSLKDTRPPSFQGHIPLMCSMGLILPVLHKGIGQSSKRSAEANSRSIS